MVTKKKTLAALKPKSVKKTVTKTAKARSPQQERVQKQKEFWKSELQSLLTQSYETLDDAVYALIDRVIARVGPSKKLAAAEREFLHLTLKTDPEIRGLLSRTLSIRERK